MFGEQSRIQEEKEELLGPYLDMKIGKTRNSGWTTKSVLKIVGLSTAIQLFLYLGFSQYSDSPAPATCQMTEYQAASVEPVMDLETGLELNHEDTDLELELDLVVVPSATTPPPASLVKYQATGSTTSTVVLEVFQVYQPVLTPSGATDETTASDGSGNTTTISSAAAASSCEVLLMDHHFAYSYGEPYVGNYTPPDCSFNRVVMNFTVAVKGRQFDRLALMYLGDTEVWRTSTAEPTTAGIEYTYIKDMTEYLYFWNSPQTLIFDLGNIVDSTYTGIINTTLTATFFTSQETVEPASLIIPISARLGSEGEPSLFTLPAQNATNTIDFPRNVNRAVFSISACGQATEEFWWGNVLQSDIDTFEPLWGTLFGYSPFREVQVYIDGQLAGVQWPFPIVFTGGIVPGLWRPIVGIDAFDLKEHEIDITPWLPILCDGKEHTFDIKVAGINDDGAGNGTLTETVGASWYVTGKIFIWQDDADSITTGLAPILHVPAPDIVVSSVLTQNATSGANETLEYTTNVHRVLSVSSSVTTQNGTSIQTWVQALAYNNYGLYTEAGAVQVTNQTTVGHDISNVYSAVYSYPAYVELTFGLKANGDYSYDAAVLLGKSLAIQGKAVFPTGLQPFAELPQAAALVEGFSGSKLDTTLNGTGVYVNVAGVGAGFGSTSQVFTFSGLDVNGAVDAELYSRDVAAVNATVVHDKETLVGKEVVAYSGAAVRKMGMQNAVLKTESAVGGV